MIKNTVKIIAGAAVLLSAIPAYALQSDRQQPISIEADQGSLDQVNHVTTFTGNVIINQGSIHIRSATAQMTRNDKGEQLMKASGHPAYFSQTLDNNKGVVNGQAENADYSSVTGVVTLTGNAIVTRGGDRAEGSVITYDTRTEIYSVKGTKVAGGQGRKRVNVVIQPTTASNKK